MSSSESAMRKELPLAKRVCRLNVGALIPSGGDGDAVTFFHGLSAEDYVDIVADIGTELWITNGMIDNCELYPSEMVPACKRVPLDLLPRLLGRAHEHGIVVLAEESLSSRDDEDLEGKMKDWALHPIEDGRRLKPSTKWLSYACPDFRDWMCRHMVEHIRVGHFDGTQFDGTPFAQRTPESWIMVPGCVGPEAREKFKRETGHEAPAKIDWHSQVFREWVRWRYDTTMEFFDAITAAAVKAKSDTPVAPVYNLLRMDWQRGLPLRRLHDKDWYPHIHGPESSLLDKMGRALSPLSEIWFWAQWHMKDIVWGESPYCDPDRTIATGLRALAHGVIPQLGGFSADIELWKDSVKLAFDEFKKRRDYIGGDSVKYAAIAVSEQTRDYRHEPDPFWHNLKGLDALEVATRQDALVRPFYQSVEGVSEIHNAEHLLSDVIFDDSLTDEGLAPYPVVLLPNVACLSEAQCDAIRRYVQDGGVLVASTETSLYDEWGNKRANFALADLFGVDYDGTGDKATQILVPQTAELRQEFGRFVCFLSPAASVKLSVDSSADVLFTKSPRNSLNGLSVKFEPYDSDVPAIVRNRVGKGTVYYIAADLGQAYMSHRLPHVAQLMAGLERTAAQPPLEFDAPLALQTTAFWHGPKRVVVHLVNCTALSLWKIDPEADIGVAGDDGQRFGFSWLRKMAPLANIGVKMNVGTVERATAVISGTDLTVIDNSLVVPAVGHGEVLVLDLR